MKKKSLGILALQLSLTAPSLLAQTTEPAQMKGLDNWQTTPLFTVGESLPDGAGGTYTPPGILDGMGAWDRGDHVELVVNHELANNRGYPYMLANGATLTGARISYFLIDKQSREIFQSSLAYDVIYNRAGSEVAGPADLEFGALNRLCSAGSVNAGEAGFVDDIFFTGEETTGGSMWILDVQDGSLWAAPALGRGGWESAAALSIPSINKTHVALILGDDRQSAPLYLYVGEKDSSAGAGFLARNGLASGKLFMWKADDASTVPSQFLGSVNFKTGSFVEVTNYVPSMVGQPGYDALGYASQSNIDAQKVALGAFQFSRPEDVHTNPSNGSQVVFASTGREQFDGGSDSWGTTYLVDVKLSQSVLKGGQIGANVRVIYDGDDADKQDFGIRSPDNLVWSSDHFAYIQEDRSVNGFGSVSGAEASIWQLQPHSGDAVRIAMMDRSAVPAGQTDFAPGDLGNWESSGIIDVAGLFGEKKGELFLFNTQAHSLAGGVISSANLAEGGQLLFLSK